VLNDATTRKTWRAWLLLAVACWACVAPTAALTPNLALGWLETRTSGSFATCGDSRVAAPPQVADPHQGETRCAHETASRVHNYLYANADPVGMIDPSGNMSIPGLAATVAVLGNVLRIAMPTIARLNTSALYNIYRGTMAAEKVMVAAEYAGVAVGIVGLVATGADSIAEKLLNNTETIGDGPYPEQFKRGGQVERISGANLGGNVSFIDDLDADGIGTSLRSHNLAGGEDAYLKEIQNDARDASRARTERVHGTTRAGKYVEFRSRDIRGIALVVAIPENDVRITLSPSFRRALQAYRDTYKVAIQVVPVRGWRK
jgi:hypothetical protein